MQTIRNAAAHRPPASSLQRPILRFFSYSCPALWLFPIVACLLIGSSIESASAADPLAWSKMPGPSQGPARAIGKPNAGCIAGAVALAQEGAGYQALALNRNRRFGHPLTVRLVQKLAKRWFETTKSFLYIGDIGQPRGGPAARHASHQIGLDVDIGFHIDEKPRLSEGQRFQKSLSDLSPSLVRPNRMQVHDGMWRAGHVELLKMAASYPEVERIFVHWTIKKKLCQIVKGDRRWLHKIRPWIGHDEHFHIRLACPKDSPACVGQAPLPPGDGCDGDFSSWAKKGPDRIVPSKMPPRSTLPAACAALLDRRS